jgi:uncharacterized OB-fold protein
MSDRPLPVPDQDSTAYWEAAKRHELLLQYCASCDHYQFYPRSICVRCGSGEMTWRQASGNGVIYSYTINYRPPGAWAADRVPYIVALVDLAEGPRMLANVIHSAEEPIQIGSDVNVEFEDVTDAISLPQFTVARSSNQTTEED